MTSVHDLFLLHPLIYIFPRSVLFSASTRNTVHTITMGWGAAALVLVKSVPMDDVVSSLCLANFIQAIFTIIGGWGGDRIGRRKEKCVRGEERSCD